MQARIFTGGDVVMPKLEDKRKEMFCMYYAFTSRFMTKKDICKWAGYGNEDSSDNYLSVQANRLCKDPKVRARVAEIQLEFNLEMGDELIRDTLIRRLVGAINCDITKYFKTRRIKTDSGRVVQDTFLAEPDYKKWSEFDRLAVTGFDSKTGNPIFMDKMKALQLLANIFIEKGDLEQQNNMSETYKNAGLLHLKENDPEMYQFIDKLRHVPKADMPVDDSEIAEGDISESDEDYVVTDDLVDDDWDNTDCFVDL